MAGPRPALPGEFYSFHCQTVVHSHLVHVSCGLPLPIAVNLTQQQHMLGMLNCFSAYLATFQFSCPGDRLLLCQPGGPCCAQPRGAQQAAAPAAGALRGKQGGAATFVTNFPVFCMAVSVQEHMLKMNTCRPEMCGPN